MTGPDPQAQHPSRGALPPAGPSTAATSMRAAWRWPALGATVVAVGVAVSVAVLGGGSTRPPAAAVPAASEPGEEQTPAPGQSAELHPPAPPALFDARCTDRPVRPTQVVLACGDAGSVATRLTWTSWQPGESRAVGVLVENDCTPTCLGGTKRSYPATFRFFAPHAGLFTTVDISFRGAGPRGERTRTSYL